MRTAIASIVMFAGAATAAELFSVVFDSTGAVDVGVAGLGNGTNGGFYVDGNTADVAIQSFVNGNNPLFEEAMGYFQLTGVTLAANTNYRLIVDAVQFQQNWDAGTTYEVGLIASEPVSAGDALISPSLVTLPDDTDDLYGPFTVSELTLNVGATAMTDPYIAFRTTETIVGLQTRIFFRSVTIDDGASEPTCRADFTADGVLNVFDILAYFAEFAAGC